MVEAVEPQRRQIDGTHWLLHVAVVDFGLQGLANCLTSPTGNNPVLTRAQRPDALPKQTKVYFRKFEEAQGSYVLFRLGP